MENLRYFRTRQSVRDFSNKEVSDELIKEIVEDAMRAPTCGNMQLYSVVATRDPELLTPLAATHFNQPAAVNAKVILTICADFNRFVKWCNISNATPGYDNFQAFMWAVADATIFSQQIVTSAEMRGLGTCYLGTVTYNAPQIAEILELPKRVVPVCALAVGYPAKISELVERLPIEAILHSDKYHDYSDDDIKILFKAKDDFKPNAQYVAENGKQSLAQVFTDIRYPKSDNETFSKIFADFIRKQGFDIP